MTWPVYFHTDQPLLSPETAAPAWRPILRHDQRQRHPTGTGGPKTYGVAVDVWRHGQHMWRSYAGGTTCDAWTDEHLGPEAPRNHDAGLWGVPGVSDVADWPIPDPACLAPVQGLQGVSDLLYTLTAIGLGDFGHIGIGEAPQVLQHPPGEPVLRQRLSRDTRGYIVVSFQERDVSVRAMVAPLEPVPDAGKPPAEARVWRATLERRQVRQGAIANALAEGSATILTSPDDPAHIVARRAKAALGITGWQAARQGATMTWHLARAPYRMDIEPVDTMADSGAESPAEETA